MDRRGRTDRFRWVLGLHSELARDAIAGWLVARGSGRRIVRYRLRDWLISRQRYWGPPIPIVYCDDCGTVPVPEDDLPVVLPHVTDFRPTGTGVSPLLRSSPLYRPLARPAAGPRGGRPTSPTCSWTLPGTSCATPRATLTIVPWDWERTERMLPVDSYAGGPEHVIRHHLYARFVTHAIHDLELLPFLEPFPHLRLHGMLTKDGAKMSKSRGNVVNPDRYIAEHGADVTRMYLLFIGPWNEGGDFSDAGIAGIERFGRRVWRLVTDPHEPGGGGVDLRPVDRAIAAVGSDLEQMKFNTGISTLMELVRWARRERARMSREELARVSRSIALLLAPLAPHLAEELWSKLGGEYSVHLQSWPAFDPRALVVEHVTLVIQVDGKTRDRIQVPAGLGREQVLERAKGRENVRRHVMDRAPRNVIFVPDRLINFVTDARGPSA